MKNLTLLLLLGIQISSFSQKRPLSHKDYDQWKAISEPQITNDGMWTVFALNPQDGDGKLVFYPMRGNQIDTLYRASGVKISPDSEFAVFKIGVPRDSVNKAKKLKKKKENFPKDSLGIYTIKRQNLEKIPGVKNFIFPEFSSEWVAWHHFPGTGEKKDTVKLAIITTSKKKKESEENGSSLVLRKLNEKVSETFSFVYQYAFDKNGRQLVFAGTGNDSTHISGVYVYNTVKRGLKNIFQGKDRIVSFSFSEDGNQLAFVADPDTAKKALRKNYQLYYWKTDQETAELVADSLKNPAPVGWSVSQHFELLFSRDGSRLFFGTIPPYLVKDTTLLEDDIVKVDVWNWKDPKLMTQQLANINTDLKRSYLAVMNTSNKKMNQLGHPEIPVIRLTKDANEETVLGISDLKYSNQHWDWNGTSDLYAISVKDGQAVKIAEAVKPERSLSVSPSGKFIYWYSKADTAWFAWQVRNGKTIQLTHSKDFSDDTDDDHPDYPGAYGIAGWTEDDNEILIYDKYDVWSIDPGKPADMKRWTSGREIKTTYRYIKPDKDERFIDSKKAMLLHVFSEKTKQSGYARLTNLSERKVNHLLLDSYYFSNTVYKAKDASDVVFIREKFEEFPDLFTSGDMSFKEIRKISEANPQQKNISWGSVEMISWKSLEGQELQGLLYKPEHFDPAKKYPMITYFYEKLSDELYRYHVPQPARSSINYSYYVSNGYVVFVPDIVYKDGYPGQSAYNCIMPGVLKVLDMGFVDKSKLGIQGHSWGGYQTAYLITRTDLFTAAEAGAPVANMTSAYGGIRWDSGLSRQAQYESTQSRLGATLWDKQANYIENSPLFYLPQVKTPVLMMHNDDDGAVPWYQGIEMFMGLKRLNKPVWMINYNGEKHGLTQRKNRKDWSLRMSQFFDHYLKGEAAPAWMSKGVPAVEKGMNYGLGSGD